MPVEVDKAVVRRAFGGRQFNGVPSQMVGFLRAQQILQDDESAILQFPYVIVGQGERHRLSTVRWAQTVPNNRAASGAK